MAELSLGELLMEERPQLTVERSMGERKEVIGSPEAPGEGLANPLGGVLIS